MSDVKNPLFENERELLERQKEEYKNALMGDVAQIKTQSQEIGKKVAIAGSVLMAGLLLTRMFSGGSKKKSKKVKAKAAPQPIAGTYSPPLPQYEPTTFGHNPPPVAHEQYYGNTMAYNRTPSVQQPVPASAPSQSTGVAKSFMNSELVQMLTSQLAALLMVYITKKVEEYLSSVSKNPDIAAIPIEVTETEATEYYYPEKDAL